MLDVFLTCDTEVWCRGWNSLDADFPTAFQRYVYGRAQRGGEYGLSFQVERLREHDLHGVFFVEPLFAGRFGLGPLEEIVGLLKEGGQEIQLHLHTEWADEARVRLLPHVQEKRQHLRHFSRDDQEALIRAGASMLESAGAQRPVAFRAGSFALNADTLDALSRCGIYLDSSYNALMLGASSNVMPGRLLTDVTRIGQILEFPVSVFTDGFGRLRHAQIGACSFEELRGALWKAREANHVAFVIVFHNFEFLNASKTDCDRIATRRFERLCAFLADNRQHFRTGSFIDVLVNQYQEEGADVPVQVNAAATGRRYFEQAWRRLMG